MSSEMIDKQLEFMELLVRAMEAGHNVSRELNEVANSLRVKMGLYIGKEDKNVVNNSPSFKGNVAYTCASNDEIKNYITLEEAQKNFSQGIAVGAEFADPSRAMIKISKDHNPSISFSDLKGIRWFRIEN